MKKTSPVLMLFFTAAIILLYFTTPKDSATVDTTGTGSYSGQSYNTLVSAQHKAQCTAGQTRNCTASGLGECAKGTQTCQSSRQWGACTSSTTPKPEVCDGLDNDCDGKIDNGCEAADLDVTYIGRTPGYNRYSVVYVLGFPQLVPGTEYDKRWPTDGETVTFTAAVKYAGTAPAASFEYSWYIDGVQVSTGNALNVLPGTIVKETFNWQWKGGVHKVKFAADPNSKLLESTKVNNQLEDRTDALSFRLHVEKTVYNTFNSLKNVAGTFSFEDWAQAHIKALNDKLQAGSALDAARIDEIVVETDGTLPRSGTHAPDPELLWDGHWGFETTEWPSSNINTWAPQIQPGLIHEWTHQLGMAHSYDANVDIASDNLISNQRLLQLNPDIVGTGADDVGNAFGLGLPLTPYFISALNSNHGFRRGFYADYLFDVPDTNTLLVKDAFSSPLKSATLRIWQSSNSKVSGSPIFVGTTDANGLFVLPNQNPPIGTKTTATNHVLKPNPFGAIDVNGRNGLLLIEVSIGADKYYSVLTVHNFNLAYWRGSKSSATYDIGTTLVLNADPTNLAHGKPASASFNSASAGTATDGDITTQAKFWEPFNSGGKVGDWWQVNLGSSSQLYRVKVYATSINFHDWYAKFHIEVSSTGLFTGEQITVATEPAWDTSRAGLQSVTYTFSPVSAQYVRIKSDIDQNFVKLQEVEVYRVT